MNAPQRRPASRLVAAGGSTFGAADAAQRTRVALSCVVLCGSFQGDAVQSGTFQGGAARGYAAQSGAKQRSDATQRDAT